MSRFDLVCSPTVVDYSACGLFEILVRYFSKTYVCTSFSLPNIPYSPISSNPEHITLSIQCIHY